MPHVDVFQPRRDHDEAGRSLSLSKGDVLREFCAVGGHVGS
jgi:hypothetical protein